MRFKIFPYRINTGGTKTNLVSRGEVNIILDEDLLVSPGFSFQEVMNSWCYSFRDQIINSRTMSEMEMIINRECSLEILLK